MKRSMSEELTACVTIHYLHYIMDPSACKETEGTYISCSFCQTCTSNLLSDFTQYSDIRKSAALARRREHGDHLLSVSELGTFL